ncbi:hypothetical protein [Bosea minatitlanensis]|uniref:Uncharacterized protein n=1 Tax=Bosea minatitlanensis TaxID=128782 RepID=A0ABW0F1A7_9HYPH|nr:hypothetical protein [Bosea minatitlanensis]MCT4496167.1 hypothetical protein [Bosea minatitlanensis]
MAALAYRFTPDLFDEPAPAPETAAREMPLRSAASLSERRFTAWRGRSGRRYVASVFPVEDSHALSFTDAVLLAVTAERQIVAARDSGPFGVEAALARWQRSVAEAGAREIHVHLLAEDGASRRAALLDLMPQADAAD